MRRSLIAGVKCTYPVYIKQVTQYVFILIGGVLSLLSIDLLLPPCGNRGYITEVLT